MSINKKNTDKMLILLAVFSVFGSILVYRSYASSKAINLKNPGTYTIDTLTNGSNNSVISKATPLEFKIQTDYRHRYCFNGSVKKPSTLYISYEGNTYQLKTSKINTTHQIGCIKLPEDPNSGQLSLSSNGIIQLQSISVQ